MPSSADTNEVNRDRDPDSVFDADWAREIGGSLSHQLRLLEPRLDAGPQHDREAERALGCAIDAHLDRLAASGVWGRANQMASQHFWRAAPELAQGRLISHARQKPLGYAGDHLMLAWIVQRSIVGEGLGRALDDYFQGHSAPQAVRNRTLWIAHRIREMAHSSRREMHILAFGSGPACEIEMACREMPEAAREALVVTLLDLDPRALQAACERILATSAPHPRLQTQHVNLGRLNRLQEAGRELPPQDLIYSLGFFDYLSNEAAHTTLAFLLERLSPEGQCHIFNFGIENRSRALMEWIGNWYLIHRTPNDLVQLANAAGCHDYEIAAEPEGVNLILTVRQTGRRRPQ